jgi:3-dehydroquinate synthetase
MMESLNLPMDTAGLEASDLWQHMKYDKKNVEGQIRFVLFGKDGLDLSVPVSYEDFAAAWNDQKDKWN